MWHGTAWHYHDLTYYGITTLLSRSMQRTWEEYKVKVIRGEVNDGDLLWYPKAVASS